MMVWSHIEEKNADWTTWRLFAQSTFPLMNICHWKIKRTLSILFFVVPAKRGSYVICGSTRTGDPKADLVHPMEIMARHGQGVCVSWNITG